MKSLVVANWKMNPATLREAKALFEATRRAIERAKGSAVIIAPPAVFLRDLAKGYRGKIGFAIQNASYEASGPHTGEISMAQAKDSGASYVLVGHAERRGMGETDEIIGKKVAAAVAQGITPILCVGEKERKHGEYFEIVREQLRLALEGVGAKSNRVIVTYEPLWTIGQDKAMDPGAMHTMSIFIRKTIVDLHGAVGHKVKILYGGSVTEKDAPAMLKGGDVRGFLVGRASQSAREFTALLESIESST